MLKGRVAEIRRDRSDPGIAMARPPVLKPREIARVLERGWDSLKFVNADRINNLESLAARPGCSIRFRNVTELR